MHGGSQAKRVDRTSIEVVLLRHAERVDETAERDEWARSCGNRYWDPPITQRGLGQSRDAGEALLHEHTRLPFSCVYVSPCLRTVQTAAELAQVIGLPLRCVPGLAECAAAVNQKGIASFRPVPTAAAKGQVPGANTGAGVGVGANAATAEAEHRQQLEPPHRLSRPPTPRRFLTESAVSAETVRFLTESELAVHCPEGTRFLARDDTYEDFFACVARLAAAERDAQTGHAISAAAAAAVAASTTAAPTGAMAAPSLRVLMVTHREGIRDLCALAGSPHRRTPYCCAAVYAFDVTPAAVGANGASTWTLLSPPSQRPGQIDPSPGATDAGPAPLDAPPAPPGTAPVHASIDVLVAELGAGRLPGKSNVEITGMNPDTGRLPGPEFAILGRQADMPQAVVAEGLRLPYDNV